MRVRICFDSASTEQVRALAVALHKVGHTAELQVGVNGPEAWSGSTPHLTPNEYASVVAHTVKYHGTLLSDLLADEVTL